MALHPLAGHLVAQDRVRKAFLEGKLPQALLFTGPSGVGKQRFGLWVAQLLLCGEAGPPCGQCQACRLAQDLGHPDLHWLMPVERPKAAEADKQVEEVAGLIAAEMDERRQQPLYQPAGGMAGHFVSTVRLLQRRAALSPAMGKRKVFLLARADRLVPQESSPEAANALMKLLEEPPANTYFVLTAEHPDRLLPTIRSRLVPLRLGRLGRHEVERFLAAHAGLPAPELAAAVERANGSIGAATAQLEGTRKIREAADELLRAVAAGPAAGAERALKQGPWQARGEFTAVLDAVADSLADATRVAAGASSRTPLPVLLQRGRPVEALVAAQGCVARVREAAQGNLNPQLLLAALVDDLAEVLWA
jgi:DNA polymerase-3 subunit delta'